MFLSLFMFVVGVASACDVERWCYDGVVRILRRCDFKLCDLARLGE
jgi:hypothetical protein